MWLNSFLRRRGIVLPHLQEHLLNGKVMFCSALLLEAMGLFLHQILSQVTDVMQFALHDVVLRGVLFGGLSSGASASCGRNSYPFGAVLSCQAAMGHLWPPSLGLQNPLHRRVLSGSPFLLPPSTSSEVKRLRTCKRRGCNDGNYPVLSPQVERFSMTIRA